MGVQARKKIGRPTLARLNPHGQTRIARRIVRFKYCLSDAQLWRGLYDGEYSFSAYIALQEGRAAATTKSLNAMALFAGALGIAPHEAVIGRELILS